MSIEVERVNERNFRRLLEMLSEDIVAMEIYWKLNNREAEVEYTWPSLAERLRFVEDTLSRCDMDINGMRPVSGRGTVGSIDWIYALLYDVCEARELVKRDGPEEDFQIAAAFTDGRFVGWEVRFFSEAEAAKAYMNSHPEYSSYSLYKKFRKVEL